MRIGKAPKRYWDFAVQLVVEQINHTATRRLDWRTPYEVHWGETPDISVFRFQFYDAIYYLEPNNKFPNPNMIPAWSFLVYSKNNRRCLYLLY
jgi:hypothetical protein